MNPTDENADSEITLVGSFQKNMQEVVCVGVNQWKGKDYFFLRIFVPAVGSEDMIPTIKGVNLEYQYIDDLYEGVKELGQVMGFDQVVKVINKAENQEIRIGTSEYKGNSLLNIRLYQKYNKESDFQPTPRGISIQSMQYPLLLEVVEKLHAFVKTQTEK